VVDEELSRLPDHYRGVIVLCDLEGMTRKEAARQLGIPEGSVASRLARARALLAKRLNQRGIVFSGGSMAVALSAGAASGSAPPALVASTIKAASLLAAGQAAGVLSAKVAALTEGVVKAMFTTKIKSVLAVVLIVGLALGGIGLGINLSAHQSAVAQEPKITPDGKAVVPGDKAKKADEKKPAEKERKVLTPEEAIKQKIGEKITVKFKVTAVLTMRVSKSSRIAPEPDAGFNEVLILKAGDSLIVQLLPPAMDTFKRLGIDPEKHFKGKMVQVTGKLGPGPYSNLLPPGLYPDQFQILGIDLSQIEVVKE